MLVHETGKPTPLIAQAVEGAAVRDPTTDRAASAPAPAPANNYEQVRAAVATANANMRSITSELQFEIDPDTRKIIVRLVDSKDQTVLRQIPAQDMIEIAKALTRMQTTLDHAVA